MAGLIAAGLIGPHVLEARRGMTPEAAATAPRNASPLTVFTTVALGGFRGLVIDALWARVCLLQDTGDYVEIAQLSDWITKLDPHLPIVWDYHSFNMAYNISSMTSSPQDRWRWISGGMSMLRDEALVYNPQETMLYERLCSMYRHKMVDHVDPGRPYYRAAFVQEMTTLLGGPHPDYATLMVDEQSVKRLLGGYKLVPQVMKAVDNAYGPLDWRLPETHMLYWATCGIQQSRGKGSRALDIMICEAMQEVFLNSCLSPFDPSSGSGTTDVCNDILKRTLSAFESAAARNGLSLESEEHFGGFYRLFLRTAVVTLVDSGRSDLAQRLFLELKDRLHDQNSDLPFSAYVIAVRAALSPAAPTAQ